jgi:hypothetical protein
MVELQAGGNARYVDAYGEFKYGKATTIPDHGRLIDADAYEKYLKDNWIPANLNALDAQPTIIPAKEGE